MLFIYLAILFLIKAFTINSFTINSLDLAITNKPRFNNLQSRNNFKYDEFISDRVKSEMTHEESNIRRKCTDEKANLNH